MKRRLSANGLPVYGRERRHVAVIALAFALAATPRIAAAAGVPIDVATPEQKKAAQARYELGAKAFAANKFEAALTEFTASYDTVASPNAHFMVARSLNELGQTVRAYNELSVVEREARVSEKYASTIEQSAALRTELARKVSVIIINVNGAAGGKLTATVGGKDAALGEQIAVAPGLVDVVIYADGKSIKHESTTLSAAEVHPFKFDLTAPGPIAPAPVVPDEPHSQSHGNRTGYWVGAGVFGAVAAAGFIMGGVEGASAKSQYDDLKNKQCQAVSKTQFKCTNLASTESSIKQKETIANVGWIIGGVGAAGAATLLIIGLTRSSHDDQKSGALPVNLVIGAGSLGVDGKF